MNPIGNIKTEWSPWLAYAIGLLATDGNLSNDGRHFSLSSKDREQLKNFLFCIGARNRIGTNKSGSGRVSFRVQVGDIKFYKFLKSIGLTPAKTKTISVLKIPKKYLFVFLRGHFDGDGTFHSYFDPRWKNSFMFYTIFISASKKHIDWLRERIWVLLKINGHITIAKNSCVYQLKYAKGESLKLLPKLYYNPYVICLSRKRRKIEMALSIVDKKL